MCVTRNDRSESTHLSGEKLFMHVSMCESNSIKEVDPSPPYLNGNSHRLRAPGHFTSAQAKWHHRQTAQHVIMLAINTERRTHSQFKLRWDNGFEFTGSANLIGVLYLVSINDHVACNTRFAIKCYTLTRLLSEQELRWLRTRKPLKTLLFSSCADTL